MQKEIKKEKDLVNYRDLGRAELAGVCAVNKVCDGNPDRLCMGMKYGRPIGMGGAGQGRTWDANFRALEKYRLNMRVIKANTEPDFKADFLEHKITMPVMVTSVSGVKLSLNDAMSEQDFQRNMIAGAKLFGTIGLSGNTVDFPDHPGVEAIKENGGWGIPVFKPQSQERLLELFRRAEAADVLAIGVDLDGFGSQNWAYRGQPLFRKSETDLRELVRATAKPVIFKGVMNLADAEIAAASGAKAIVVSNHGGRVMDWGLGVADVLPEIAEKLKGKITIMADGAIRTGFDVLKVLALGADVVSLGRPLIQVNLGGGPEEGARAIKLYLDYVKSDLRLAMLMTGCDNLKEISKDILIKIS
ncbi:MAG: alpha-hydroxy-acid oxidizing protein [bacterium]|nr:alpha-hydroxy-acid oxidizing protein [bacterium]